MRLLRSWEVVDITNGALGLTLEASTKTHPNEYVRLLRGGEARRVGVDRDDHVVTDVFIIPGTASDPYSAIVRNDPVPNDFHAVGLIHSYPNDALRPSDTDLDTFGSGRVHIIIGSPYDPDGREAFDQSGETRDLSVLGADLSDPESPFDFTQNDINAELDR